MSPSAPVTRRVNLILLIIIFIGTLADTAPELSSQCLQRGGERRLVAERRDMLSSGSATDGRWACRSVFRARRREPAAAGVSPRPHPGSRPRRCRYSPWESRREKSKRRAAGDATEGNDEPRGSVGEGVVDRVPEDPARSGAGSARRGWSFGTLDDLNGVMLGMSKPLVRLHSEVARWASASFDSDDEDDEENDDEMGHVSTWSSVYEYDPLSNSGGQGVDEGPVTGTSTSSSVLGQLVNTALGGVSSWVAGRRERARAAAAAAAQPPPVMVVKLTDAQRAQTELGADEMHFLPVENSGWSIALLRYQPTSQPSDCYYGGTSVDASMWDDSDFTCGEVPTLPVMLVPGCASNAYTFDTAPGYSLARHLAAQGHDTWIVECRGVGFSRPWGGEEDCVDPKTGAPLQHIPTFGDYDFDTYLREDLPAAAAHIAERTGSTRLAGIGHSMGGMLVACLAAGAGDDSSEESGTVKRDEHEAIEGGARWKLSRVVTIASCLECSPQSGPNAPESSYARLAALAGAVPDYLYGGRAKTGPVVPQIPLGPLSIGQAFAIESVLGAPPQAGTYDEDDEGAEFWQKSAVSISTCYPGATEPALVRKLLLKGFGNVPLRLVLQMATLFAPGGLATREETAARRERATAAAREAKEEKKKKKKKGEGSAASTAVSASAADAGEAMNAPTMVMKSAQGGGGEREEGEHPAYYLDVLRARRPRLMMIAADCDPVIPPEQVAATAAAVGGEYVCIGGGPGPDDPAGRVARQGESGRDGNVTGSGKENLESKMMDQGEHLSHYDLLCGRRAPDLVYPVVTEFINRAELFWH